jgi:hypothetical protein
VRVSLLLFAAFLSACRSQCSCFCVWCVQMHPLSVLRAAARKSRAEQGKAGLPLNLISSPVDGEELNCLFSCLPFENTDAHDRI